eukprot:TRINITY_DN8116_c0_g1_i1.p1 TRINITY_DN8116_c0_g1~~TRINITY_DN8116_c0_g1_i1.p1  ORF type:complete len:391 (-),score=85.80 TRINITY_DN8116_c0_g1_i1:206-1378(-)
MVRARVRARVRYCFCHLGLWLQLFQHRKRIPPRLCIWMEHLLELALLGFGCGFTCWRPHWPFTHKVALMFQTIIFTFKIHSYCSTNRELARGAWPSPKKSHLVPKPLEDLTITEAQAEAQLLGYGRYEVEDMPVLHLRAMLSESRARKKEREGVYPGNVNFRNFSEFLWMPTLCYEVSYPRTNIIRPSYLIEKAITAFGVLSLMWHLLVNQMRPSFQASVDQPLHAVADLILPTMAMVLLGFFLVFDCILCGFAELTRFADREFYKDWWNSTTFEEFSRKWNKPVHEFLLRHVYLSLLTRHKWGRTTALVFTFLWSIALHELVLSMVFGMFRPWLALFSLSQLPLRPLMSASAFKGKRLGNLVFWYGQALGIPLIMVLYTREYCASRHAC